MALHCVKATSTTQRMMIPSDEGKQAVFECGTKIFMFINRVVCTV
eukprot:COSAG01_NODE_729_length_14031_cov_24.502800_5_plen_45_part_00